MAAFDLPIVEEKLNGQARQPEKRHEAAQEGSKAAGARELLREPDAYPLFVTGAGVSLASGIPTFRGTDPEAVWSQDVLEKGTRRYFERDPVGSWLWYLKRFEACLGATPNAGHEALVRIEQAFGSRFMIITQNVDGLHTKAGSQNVVEVHGSARKMRCSRRGCKNGAPRGLLDWDSKQFDAFRLNPCMETVPRCPACGKLIRAHVLWFDEGYGDHVDYGINTALGVFDRATVVLFVGTSFAVTITDLVIQQAWELGRPMFSINLTGDDMHQTLIPIVEKAEDFLPALATALDA